MIFKFRITSDEVKDFIRIIELESTQTFFDLHNAIQDSVSYDKSHIASFFILNDEWEKQQEIPLIVMSDDKDNEIVTMENAVIPKFIETVDQRLVYIFDFFVDRGLLVEVIEIKLQKTIHEYPRCTYSNGDAPAQFIFDDKEKNKFDL